MQAPPKCDFNSEAARTLGGRGQEPGKRVIPLEVVGMRGPTGEGKLLVMSTKSTSSMPPC